ncbi:hypothetical protein [Vulgatibacter sp.]|uniref:hypothetical protein n=1 Tax=Vulgatibacter sp. TaxID=1971226 RepID=UPI003569DC6D
MRSILLSACVVLSSLVACSEASAPAAATPAAAASCEHGVQPDICARCNPKLEAAFRAQNDWCPEHARPESQCVICNPELAAKGIK